MSVTVAGVPLETMMSVTVTSVRLEPVMSVTVAGVRLEPMMSVTVAGVRLEPVMSVTVAGIYVDGQHRGIYGNVFFVVQHYIHLNMLIQYDLPTKKTPNNIHECSA